MIKGRKSRKHAPEGKITFAISTHLSSARGTRRYETRSVRSSEPGAEKRKPTGAQKRTTSIDHEADFLKDNESKIAQLKLHEVDLKGSGRQLHKKDFLCM